MLDFDGIHLVKVSYVNVYLIEKGNEIVLIDAGLEGVSNYLFQYLEEIGREPKDISIVVITHKHGDHTLGLQEILEKTNAKVAAHKDEIEGIKNRAGINKIDIILEDRENIVGLRVIHTPGHTPGHICLLDEDNSALFVGDLVYVENGELDEIPYHYSENPKLNRESIKKLANIEFKHLLPSHGDPIKDKGKESLLKLIQSFG